jgi:DNA-directed RNA polymerase subunit D
MAWSASFIFSVETDGSYSAQEIITRAATSIRDTAIVLNEVMESL